MSYRLDDPGMAKEIVAEGRKRAQAARRRDVEISIRVNPVPEGRRSGLAANRIGVVTSTAMSVRVRVLSISAKLLKLRVAVERCPSGLRSTLGKRV